MKAFNIKFKFKIYLPEFVYRLCLWLILYYRKMRYGYSFMRIPLTQGKFAIVDVDDFKRLNNYKWHLLNSGRGRVFYAVRQVRSNNGRKRRCILLMHKQILDSPEGLFVDHINHNGLDNRKSNLRLVTQQQNNWNQRKKLGNSSSRYKGVTFFKNIGKWMARITYNGKSIFIGYFDDEVSAAKAYDAKARELYGEFAALNFPK